jgi:hypothetical protein
MNRTLSWMAVLATSMLMSFGAVAQSATAAGDGYKPGDLSVNCPPTGAVSSKQAAAKPMAKSHATRMASTRNFGDTTFRQQMDQCGAKTNRKARAECVRQAWEARDARLAASRTASTTTAQSGQPC